MSNRPIPGEVYKHFKGNLYRIVTIARHSETEEELVVYQALYGDYPVYARELQMFLEPVDKVKYPDVIQEFRFEKVKELVEPICGNANGKEGICTEKECTCASEEVSCDMTKEVTEMSSEEECKIDPLVLEFLDADSYEERLNILAGLHHRITNEMITTMALSVDLEIDDGDVEERYEELKSCLLTFEKYECNRLR